MKSLGIERPSEQYGYNGKSLSGTDARISAGWMQLTFTDADGNLGFLSKPVQWLTDPQYNSYVVVVVILWSSMGVGFLSFVAGFKQLNSELFEAGTIDGVSNRWQELWYITLPNMKPMLMFGAVMSITGAFGVCDVTMTLCGYPSTDYAARTIVTHLFDYGFVDSLGATEIVLFMEDTYNIQITQKDITLYPMNTIEEIAEVVEQKLA